VFFVVLLLLLGLAPSGHYRGRIAGLSRDRAPDDPELVEARSLHAEARIAEFVKKTLAEAPPLSDQQRVALAELLKPVRVDGAE
jgi:hypothetical protein